MRRRSKLPLWTIASLFMPLMLLLIVTGLFWLRLDQGEIGIFLQIIINHIEYVLVGTVVVMASLGFLLNWLIVNLIVPINMIEEETRIITRVNPGHRIDIKGSREILALAEVINEAARTVGEIRKDVKEKIRAANARIEEEKDTLAALIAEMEEGVLVCNMEGQILLYNKTARGHFSDRDPGNPNISAGSGIIGLGRSVFMAIPKDLIVHAVEEILMNMGRGEGGLVSHLVTATSRNGLLRIRVVPILHHEEKMIGFILFLYDITDRVEMASRRDKLFQELTRGMRSSVANIRAAIEAIIDFPQMKEDHEKKFRGIIHDESVALTERLNETVRELSEQFKMQWLLDRMSGKDFLEALKRRAAERLGMAVETESDDNPPWISIESYSFMRLMLALLENIGDAGRGHVTVRLSGCGDRAEAGFAYIDLEWEGEPLDVERLKTAMNRHGMGSEPFTLGFDEVMEHHDAEIWSMPRKEGEPSRVRILLKSAEPSCRTGIDIRVRQDSRPEFYDFDLFNQAGQSEELDSRLLTDLSYTVFDTETTGLDPSAGDEIISIGAIRITNGRLLKEEVFEQLVNPRQILPRKAVEITGIRPEMLDGQPVIDEILGIFHRFCRDTVLIAHNAAFDMRFLQMKELRTGIRFINPVLDTLLLSAVVHPNQESHNLESIARRLGINIIGRHTALGDAIATGEVFLKLIPLLAEKGVLTFRDARRASLDRYYARARS